mmetsp:Transcript_6020/g.16032  ORF Transcript_6020/g.16032 Transcript_6020/m.16032 type:complete len:211 (-) Transcript_6020:2299-2931(-)
MQTRLQWCGRGRWQSWDPTKSSLRTRTGCILRWCGCRQIKASRRKPATCQAALRGWRSWRKRRRRKPWRMERPRKEAPLMRSLPAQAALSWRTPRWPLPAAAHKRCPSTCWRGTRLQTQDRWQLMGQRLPADSALKAQQHSTLWFPHMMTPNEAQRILHATLKILQRTQKGHQCKPSMAGMPRKATTLRTKKRPLLKQLRQMYPSVAFLP